MKGKKNFTKSEADKILLLIEEKLKSPKDKQKTIRDKIRKIGFYYTDFAVDKRPGGYNQNDFLKFVKIVD